MAAAQHRAGFPLHKVKSCISHFPSSPKHFFSAEVRHFGKGDKELWFTKPSFSYLLFFLRQALDCSGSAGWRTALVPPLQNGEAIADDFWLPKGPFAASNLMSYSS